MKKEIKTTKTSRKTTVDVADEVKKVETEIKTYCKYDELVDPLTLKDHPKNRNKHGQDQIERLAKMYKYHGIRHPIIISNRSGFIVAGHGRRLAALRAGVKWFPVVYQEFKSDEAEYTFIQSDNAIAEWSILDLSGIHDDIGELGPFDLEMLGIKDFKLEPDPITEDETDDKSDDEINNKSVTCPVCGHEFVNK
jgi:hypothetical protein